MAHLLSRLIIQPAETLSVIARNREQRVGLNEVDFVVE